MARVLNSRSYALQFHISNAKSFSLTNHNSRQCFVRRRVPLRTMRLRIFERCQRLIQDIFDNSRFVDTVIARLTLHAMNNSSSTSSFDPIRHTSGPRRNNSLTPPTLSRSFSSCTFNRFSSLLTLSSSRCRRSTSWYRSKQIDTQSFIPFVGKRTSFRSK